MKNYFIGSFVLLCSTVSLASSSNVITPRVVMQLLLSNPSHMGMVDKVISNMVRPKGKMVMVGISAGTNSDKYSSVITYVDDGEGTFFSPNIGSCSLRVIGKVKSLTEISVDKIVEEDCGE